VYLGMKSRVGMTGGSTRYRPLYEDRPRRDDQLKHHEHDYYNACEFRSRSASGQPQRGFDSWSTTIAPTVVGLRSSPQVAKPWLHRKPVLHTHRETVGKDKAAYWLVGGKRHTTLPG